MTAGPAGPGRAAASELFGDALPRAERYVELLANEGVEWGLIGPRETERLWERHVLNSLAVLDAVGAGERVVDVGSGAGLPGIPLALARPGLAITLLEPLERRVRFLELCVAELELAGRVRVVRGRAEEHRERYDVVTCRAVAPLTRLLAWTRPLFYPSGRLVALKGESAQAELDQARKELRKARLTGRVQIARPYPDADPTRLLVVEPA